MLKGINTFRTVVIMLNKMRGPAIASIGKYRLYRLFVKSFLCACTSRVEQPVPRRDICSFGHGISSGSS